MRLRAIMIILRKNGYFHTRDAITYITFGSKPFRFPVDRVPAARKGEGYGVALILEPSQADKDFRIPILFPTEAQVRLILEAFERRDELTGRLLGRGWISGPRPYLRLHHFC